MGDTTERKRCECCGRLLPKKVIVRKYATPQEALEGRKAKILARVQARVAQDVAELLPLVNEVFYPSDLGDACRRVGRHWSEHGGALMRLVRAGFVVKEPATESLDARVLWQYRKVVQS